MDNVCLLWFLPAGFNVRTGGIWKYRSSRRGLSGGFDLGGHPLLLSPGVLSDERPVLVELDVLVSVVHQAVPAVPRFDLSAQRVLAALQWLLVVVTERRGERGGGGI